MGSSSSQVTGYAYYLDFAYTFCERIDELYSVYRNGVSEWEAVDEGVIGVPLSIEIQTGTVATIYGSGNGPSTVKIYDGTQANIPEMIDWTGKVIGYRNTATLIFPQAFIGDNVQTISKFSLIAGNTSFEGISNFKNIDGNANPVDIIYNIFIEDLQMDTAFIDEVSFQTAAAVVFDEGLGVGLIMGTTRKAMDWVEDQLAIIDGVLFVDVATNKLTIKLLRDDYDINTIVTVDEDNASKITLENVSWAETYNKFVFKYTYLLTGKETSVEFINTAARQALGYDRIKTISFPSINSGAVLNTVAKRIMLKMGTPLAGLKVAVDYIDYPGINIGDVIKFSSIRLGIVDKVFRVMKITGDSEETASVNLECIEDIFAKSFNVVIPNPDDGYEYIPPDYSLELPRRYDAKDAQREMSASDGMVWFATKGDPAEFVLSSNCEQVGGLTVSANPHYYGTLASVIPEDFTGLNGALVSSKEYNRDYTFTITDVDGDLFEFFGSELTMQTLRHVAYIGDEEFSFKSMTDLGGGVFEVSGVIRGLNDTGIVQHNIGEAIFISPSDGRFTSIIPISTATPSLYFFNHNHVDVSPKVLLTPTYTFTNVKPYNPVPYQTVWGATKTIGWRPRVALAGANYRNEDRIVGGEDEGVVTGYYVVTFPNLTETTIYPQEGDTLITVDTTQTGVHYITHKDTATHRFDIQVPITIT